MTTLTQEDRAVIERWRDDLRTTTAKQGKYRLGDGRSGYCCLGRLCVVSGEKFIPWLLHPSPVMQPVASTALSHIGYAHIPIAYLNDSANLSFNEIADVLDIFLIDPDAFSGDESV